MLMGSAGEELSAPTLETFLPSPHPSTTGCLHIRRDWGTRKDKLSGIKVPKVEFLQFWVLVSGAKAASADDCLLGCLLQERNQLFQDEMGGGGGNTPGSEHPQITSLPSHHFVEIRFPEVSS